MDALSHEKNIIPILEVAVIVVVVVDVVLVAVVVTVVVLVVVLVACIFHDLTNTRAYNT